MTHSSRPAPRRLAFAIALACIGTGVLAQPADPAPEVGSSTR